MYYIYTHECDKLPEFPGILMRIMLFWLLGDKDVTLYRNGNKYYIEMNNIMLGNYLPIQDSTKKVHGNITRFSFMW